MTLAPIAIASVASQEVATAAAVRPSLAGQAVTTVLEDVEVTAAA